MTLYALAEAVVERAATLSAAVDAVLAATTERRVDAMALIERAVARVCEEDSPHQRRELLEEIARLFERDLGDPDRALSSLLEAYREAPSREAWWDLERLAGITERHAELEGALVASITELPAAERANAWLKVGSLRGHRQDAVAQALAAYVTALQIDPDLGEAHERRLDLLRKHERWQELADALAERASLESSGGAARRHLERAAAHERLGEALAAESAWRDALDGDPGCDEARRALEASIRRRGDEGELRRFLSERLAWVEGEEQLSLRRELAALCLRAGDRARAVLHWEELRAASPGDQEALRALARFYEEDDRVRDLLDVLQAQVGIVADKRERATMCRRMAELWLSRLGETREAEQCLEWLVADDAADEHTYRTLARLYRQSGRPRAAIDVMTRHAEASASATVRGELYVELAGLYEKELCDVARAIEYWERAERVLEEPRPAQQALARLYAAHETLDIDRAGAVLERALAAGADDFATLLALARIRRLERRFERAGELLAQALEKAALPAERARALAGLARLLDDQEQPGRAVNMALEALALCPELTDAREHAAELLFAEHRFAEAVPLYQRMVQEAENQKLKQSLLLRLARAANAAGQAADTDELALASLADDAARPAEERVEAMCQLGLIALRDGRAVSARVRLELASGLGLQHRPTQLALVELDGYAPAAVAHLSGVSLLPEDHKRLHRLLDACESERAWPAALQVLRHLIELERAPATRARYRHAAGAICRESLGRTDEALACFEAALADDLSLDRAAAAIEAILTERDDKPALLAFYLRELGRFGPESGDGRREDRLRLWDAVAALCLDHLDDRPGGVTALEVAVELDAKSVERRARLCALYLEAGEDSRDRAIAEHQALLRLDPERCPAYLALETLYRDTGQPGRAAACARAAQALAGEPIDPGVPPARAGRSLDAELWAKLRHPEEDRLLDLLFAAVTPALAAAQARSGRPVPFRKGTIPPGDVRVFARALARVSGIFELPPPACYARPDLAAPVTFRTRVAGDRLVAELLLGAPIVNAEEESVAAAELAMALAHLRPERFARVLVDGAAPLARVIDAARALGTGAETPGGAAATLALLRESLSPLALDQVSTIGARLAERGIGGEAGAAAWLAAGERTAARAALVVADLATCVARLRAAGAERARVVDLAWSSVTDELAEVGRRLGTPAAAGKPASTAAASASKR